ncbi:MAG: SPOR domain-containing protein [Rhodospirillales bacterium]|nr:SPOR domain-containing protein [Rhodospirillales bacterium]
MEARKGAVFPGVTVRWLVAAALVGMTGGCAMLWDPEAPTPVSPSALLDPSGGVDQAEIALAALAKGDYSRAEVSVNQALRRNPREPYALLAGALLFQNTDRPQKARQLYEDLVALRPNLVTTLGGNQRLIPRSLGEVAEQNLTALAPPARQPPSLRGNQPMPQAAPTQPAPMTPLTPQSALAAGLPLGMGESGLSGPLVLNSAADNNAAQRFLILRRLAEEGLITEDEYRARRSANLGALLPLSATPPPATGLDRAVPAPEQIVERLRALARAYEGRTISAAEQAAERTIILESLLPAQPRNRAMAMQPPKSLLEAAAAAGRIERLRGFNLITADEQMRERDALEKASQTLAGATPAPAAPAAMAGTTQRASGTTAPTALAGAKGKTAAPVKGAKGKPAVHLASFKSREQADKDWPGIRSKNPEVAKLTMQVSRIDLKGKGTYWRLKAGPLASAKAAADLCKTLKGRRQYCEPATMD